MDRDNSDIHWQLDRNIKVIILSTAFLFFAFEIKDGVSDYNNCTKAFNSSYTTSDNGASVINNIWSRAKIKMRFSAIVFQPSKAGTQSATFVCYFDDATDKLERVETITGDQSLQLKKDSISTLNPLNWFGLDQII